MNARPDPILLALSTKCLISLVAPGSFCLGIAHTRGTRVNPRKYLKLTVLRPDPNFPRSRSREEAEARLISITHRLGRSKRGSQVELSMRFAQGSVSGNRNPGSGQHSWPPSRGTMAVASPPSTAAWPPLGVMNVIALESRPDRRLN